MENTRSNKFAGKCANCGGQVPAGVGMLTGKPGAWITTHKACPVAAKAAPKFPPTAEQEQAVKLFATGENLAIEAGAGTGKTSTLILLADHAAENGRTGTYLAFNKAIVTEAAAKMPGNMTCSTAHGLAYRAHGYAYKARLGGKRVRPIDLADMLGTDQFVVEGHGKGTTLARSYIASLVMRTIGEFCKTADAVPTRRHVPYIEGIDLPTNDGRRTYANNDAVSEFIFPWVQAAWADLAKIDGRLPYSHDVYLKQYQLSQPRIDTDFILFDEAQDANPVMLAIVKGQADHSQLVYVGDSNQQIYEFTGAVNALGAIREAGANVTYLSQSFRFGQGIADVANVILGRVEAELRLTGAGTASVVGPVAEPDCILTRGNATAVKTVMRELADGRKPYLVGGGTEIVRFAEAARQLQSDGFTGHPELTCFGSWGEVQEYVSDDETGDLRLMVKLVDDFGVDAIIEALGALSSEKDADVVISTAHKAKGREWDSVQLAGDFPKARGGQELPASELRLLYVAVTRARRELDITGCPQAVAARLAGLDEVEEKA